MIPYAQTVYDVASSVNAVAFSQRGATYGIFVYGPYVFLPSGTFDITFEVKVGEHGEGYLGTVDVSEDYARTLLCRKDIYGFETPTNVWTNYTMTLATTRLRRAVEFRISTNGAADFYLNRVIVKKVRDSAAADFGAKTFSRKDLSLDNAELTSDGFIAYTHNEANGTLWYGPYVTLPADSYRATFFIKASSLLPNPNERILRLEVSSTYGFTKLASRDLLAFDFQNPENASRWQSFTLGFTIDHEVSNIEFRGLYPSNATDISLAFISIQKADS
jgi:hypothetical protein